MFLNTIAPAPGSRKKNKRLGRGIGSTLGKTAGRGHKGQHARAGGFHKVGFEGGQMPLQRRLPKVGFKSHLKASVAQVRLSELNGFPEGVTIDIAALIAANVVPARTKRVRVFDSGELNGSVTLRGVSVTRGARALIESKGGKVEA
ncbi:50S ribosomal protein L15 [Methylococcus sp. EFPC2]|uniref:50S ribosomal protein L15 n=1 Tax=Methylococcus sp. EFPC2 TaxID=2812648 RepID=UPI001968630A|nr:50S ribosomal protein L15 [Methylococcus sp. EFPC2]QSA95945.1 50S ribosomal protein L15 [Methylococcus sp. EFPC2]